MEKGLYTKGESKNSLEWKRELAAHSQQQWKIQTTNKPQNKSAKMLKNWILGGENGESG